MESKIAKYIYLHSIVWYGDTGKMPKLIFDEREYLKRIDPERPVNKSGNIYVGRKYHGKKVIVMVMKGENG